MALEIYNNQIKYINQPNWNASDLISKLIGVDPCLIFGNFSGTVGVWVWDEHNILTKVSNSDDNVVAEYIYRAIDQYINPNLDTSNLVPENDGTLDIKNSINNSNVGKLEEIKNKLGKN